jgi:hypothetical protein
MCAYVDSRKCLLAITVGTLEISDFQYTKYCQRDRGTLALLLTLSFHASIIM